MLSRSPPPFGDSSQADSTSTGYITRRQLVNRTRVGERHSANTGLKQKKARDGIKQGSSELLGFSLSTDAGRRTLFRVISCSGDG